MEGTKSNLNNGTESSRECAESVDERESEKEARMNNETKKKEKQ